MSQTVFRTTIAAPANADVLALFACPAAAPAVSVDSDLSDCQLRVDFAGFEHKEDLRCG